MNLIVVRCLLVTGCIQLFEHAGFVARY